jgi:DNA-binding NarL/FixJ family response regulator
MKRKDKPVGQARDASMNQQRVLILYTQSLFGEGIQHILGEEPTVEVIGVEPLAPESLAIVASLRPDVLIVAEGDHSPLIGQILQTYADLPLICVSLEKNTVQIYYTHQVPARSVDLKETLRHLRKVEGRGTNDERRTTNDD